MQFVSRQLDEIPSKRWSSCSTSLLQKLSSRKTLWITPRGSSLSPGPICSARNVINIVVASVLKFRLEDPSSTRIWGHRRVFPDKRVWNDMYSWMLSPEGHLLWLATISYDEGPFKSIAKSVKKFRDENGEFSGIVKWQWCANVAFCVCGIRAGQIFSRLSKYPSFRPFGRQISSTPTGNRGLA